MRGDRTFTGQKQDNTGLLYYNARYYDPSLGQFLSPDTLVPDAGLVLDYNRYMYVRGNPLKYTDPTGHDPQCEVGTSACDAEWTLWRQYMDTADRWSSWDQFLQGYGNYMQYVGSPDLYLNDMLVINSAIDGDIESASFRNAAANAYSQNYLGQPLARTIVSADYAQQSIIQAEASGDLALYQATVLILAVFVGGDDFFKNPLMAPGPYAHPDGWIEATGPRVTGSQRQQIQSLGAQYGCHTCGRMEPGGTGVWIGDHQPPTSVANGNPQRLYPHCQACSNRQGGFLSWFTRRE